MGIIKEALRKEINSNNLNIYNNTTATILEYDIVSNTAIIQYPNPNGDGLMYRENVTFANSLGANTGSGIFAGQTCAISFIGGNIWAPIITGLTNNLYESKTLSDQGAFIVDTDINDLDNQEPENITPMSDTWIDDNNDNEFKYNNELGDFTESDTFKEVHELIQSLNRYTQSECGTTNLKTKSTIKFKDNGDIDIFISNNTGIRLSQKDNRIYLYGDSIYFNNQKIKIEDYNSQT